MAEKQNHPKRHTYTPDEQREADELNARITAGDTSAYERLTRLAVSVVREGRWTREQDPAP